MATMLVRAVYKTGVYVAELLEEDNLNNRALVKVVAVLKHPHQGDLHRPKKADVDFFHQRKALAQFEKAWVPLASMKRYEGDELDYKDSLQSAWRAQLEQLEGEQTEWARLSIAQLKELKKGTGFNEENDSLQK